MDKQKKLHKEQVSVLNFLWEYFQASGKPVPARLLFSKIEMPNARKFVENIGGEFVFETREDGVESYEISFYGLMNTDYYHDIEELLVRYLDFIKLRYKECPECTSILNTEVEERLRLSVAESKALRILVNKAHLFSGSMGWSSSGEWSASFPEDVEELRFVDDMRDYLRSHVMKSVRHGEPVSESDRYIRMFSERGNLFNDLGLRGNDSIVDEAPELIRNMRWVVANWRKHLAYILVFFIIVVGVFVLPLIF